MPMGGLQGPLREGRAWFYEDGRYGFINEAAEVVVPAVLEESANFHEGRALAKRGGRYGFISPDGREAVPCRFLRASTFGDGRALVQRDDGSLWLIGPEGEVIAPCPTALDDWTGLWDEGRMRIRRAGRYGYLDGDGREAVPCRYTDAHPRFWSGLAGVCIDGRWGFIDRDGREVIPPRYAWVEPFFAGVGTAGVMREGRYGRVDPDGRERVACGWASPVGRYCEGRARVDLGALVDPGRDGVGTLAAAQLGFVDEGGVVVIPCRYETATDFADGLAWVTTPARRARFAIDRDGNERPAP